MKLKIGRWTIPGSPIAILVDFNCFYVQKDDIYSRLWELYHVDSLHSYGDYDEASMFSYAAGLVVESFYNFYLDITKKVVYHGNEWMTGLGLLYINHKIPAIATIFTTHATSIGRSIAGNNKPLYKINIRFQFTKNDVTELLEKAVEYPEEIRNRVEMIIFAQMRKYNYLFSAV